MNATMKILGATVLCAAAIGCSKKEVRDDAPPADTVTTTTETTTSPISSGTTVPGAYTAADLDRDSCLRQRTIYFDLDSDRVRTDFNAVVSCHAKYLRDVPTAALTLEGHADERGSREYNIGLGERRAGGVGNIMSSQGARQSQMTLTSYGEERPVCEEATEACWSKNRRVEFIYGR